MQKSNRYLAVICCCFLLCLPGCTERSSQTLRIGTNVWPGYEPLYLARKLKKWSENNIRLVEYPSATEVMRAFRNHALEAASLTLDEVLLLRHDNIPVKVILVHDISHGGDVVMARPPIKNVKELKGKMIGVESNALGAFVLTRALEINGLSISDIRIKTIDVNMHERSYLNKTVDAVVTFEPVRTKLLSAGANEIFTSRDMPNEIVDVMVVHEDFLRREPGVIRALINDWFDAVQYLKSNKDSAAHIIAERLKVSPQEVNDSYAGLRIPSREENLTLLEGDNANLNSTLDKLNRVLVDNKIINTPVMLDGILSGSYLKNR